MEGAELPNSPLAPTRAVALIRRFAGPLWKRVGIAGVLEVPGRRSGAPLRITLIPVNLDGSLYLLSFGGVTNWARNLRAAGKGVLHHRGRKFEFVPVEVDGDERDRVITRYLAGSGPIKKDFFRRPAATDHPTFRLDATT